MPPKAGQGAERRSIVEKLGGGQGIGAIIMGVVALAGLFLTQCQKTEEPVRTSEMTSGAPAAAGPAANIAGPAALPGSATVESAAATNASQPATAQERGASHVDQPPPTAPHAGTQVALGPPPNAKYPHRAVGRFQARVPIMNMVSEPRATATPVAELGPDDVFYVGTAQGDYYPASTAGGVTGWLHVDLVTVVHGDAD